ncbi:MAG: 4Fe-4S binding protein [Bacillota bacterium]
MRLSKRDELCSGCRSCILVCSMENFLKADPTLAALRIKGHFPVPGKYEVVLCDQCGECEKACPTGAIYADGEAYRVKPEECIACMACIEACPKGAIWFNQALGAPVKCVLCGECVRYCPRQAIVDETGEVKWGGEQAC